MLIPLYVLIGVWGGRGGWARPQVRRLHGGGLAPDAGRDHRRRPRAGTFDMAELVGRGQHVDLPRLRRGVRRQGARSGPSTAGCPTRTASRRPRWPRCSPGSSRRPPPTAFWPSIPFYPGPADDWRTPMLVLASIGLVYGSLLAFRARRARRDRLLEPGADEPDRDRALRRERLRLHRRAPADGQPRAHLGRPLPARGGDRAADEHRELRLLGMADGRAGHHQRS